MTTDDSKRFDWKNSVENAVEMEDKLKNIYEQILELNN